MDSFYDVPRRAPVPTSVEKFLAKPVVPEVSMICHSKTPVNNFMPYHTWKMQHNSNENRNILTSNRENISGQVFNQFTNPQNNSQMFKKQVRFESPVLQQRICEPHHIRKIGMSNDNKCPQTYEKTNVEVRQSEMPLSGKTFEQIYMANVPTRQLDLSMIDLPNNMRKIEKVSVILEEQKEEVQSNFDLKADIHLESEINKNKENELPKTYKEFLATQRKTAKESKVDANDSVTDIFNYKKNRHFGSNNQLKGKNYYETKTNLKINGTKDDTASREPLQYFSPVSIKKPNDINSTYKTDVYKSKSPLCNIPQCATQIAACKNLDSSYQNHLKTFKNCSPQSDRETQTSVICTPYQKGKEIIKEQKDDPEPTNRDLLKIIAQQNEQLLILQKQVAMLLNKEQKSQTKQIEGNYMDEKYVTSTQNENFRNPATDVVNSPRKRGMSKFSIDLMTSFEVAIRPQHKQNFINYEPKIQEITESETLTTGVGSDRTDKTVVDTSLHLQEPVKVREVCPSPEPSININMNDYDSSEDDEVTASEIGATFYHNLMGQVNNILKKAQIQTKEELSAREGCVNGVASDKIRERTMSRVKEATLKHLKSIGVTIGPIDDDDSLSFGNDCKEYSPTEVSFAVKQILMKYLPDDQLAKITYKQAQAVPTNKEGKGGIIPTRPEFSFASVQYMKKYNLLQNNDIKPRDTEQVPKASYTYKAEGPKILDITALKMQPKLL